MTTSQVMPVPTGQTGRQETLSEWAGPYVTGMLGKAQALSEAPYQVYKGPLTAGESALQTQAFKGIGALSAPGQFTAGTFANQFNAPGAYQAGTFQGGTFGTDQAQQYMNPYLSAALAPSLEEARRQAEISRVGQAGRLTQAGAYGGSRQAIMESELNRNLMQAQNKMLGEGYASAYDKAMAQYNADQARAMEAQRMGEQSRQFGAQQGMTAAQLAAQYGLEGQRLGEQSKQFGAQYGLSALEAQRQNLQQQLAAGAQQRGITAEGIEADKAEFERQRDYPFKMLQFQQSMLQGLPIQSVAAQYQQPSSLQSTINTMGGLMDLYAKMFPQAGKKP